MKGINGFIHHGGGTTGKSPLAIKNIAPSREGARDYTKGS